MLTKIWKRLRVVSEATATSYTDQRTSRLEAVRNDLVDTRRVLAGVEARWAKLIGRDDPESHEARSRIGPHLLDLRDRVRTLAAEEAQTEEAIAATAALVEKYAAMTAASEGRWVPILARVADVDAAAAFRESSELARLANRLHVATGDRAFRKPVDPFAALLDTLSATMREAERQKLLRRHTGPSEIATGTDGR